MVFSIESITYMVYIYSLILLFIHIQPSPINLILFYIYCFATTWYISHGCNSGLIKNTSSRLLIVSQYSLLCTISFYIINLLWKGYNDYFLNKMLLFLLPFVYIINIKLCEYLFECESFHTFNVASRIYYVVIVLIAILILYTRYLNRKNA
jgi:hypothetical protein